MTALGFVRRLRPIGLTRGRGFTLVEMMVTLVIGAILLSIAAGGYSSYVRKSRRTEAKTALLDLAGREERYFSTNSAYTNDWTQLGYTTTSTAGNATPVGNGYYNANVSFCTAPAAGCANGSTFTVYATPLVDQLKDSKCQYFQVDQTGAQKSTDNNADRPGAITGNDTTSTCW